LKLLGSEYIVSRAEQGDEFKIWDLKNYECMQTYREDSDIKRLIVMKDNSVITQTVIKTESVNKNKNHDDSDNENENLLAEMYYNKINLWQIKV
jgi:hypothetical protein